MRIEALAGLEASRLSRKKPRVFNARKPFQSDGPLQPFGHVSREDLSNFLLRVAGGRRCPAACDAVTSGCSGALHIRANASNRID